MLIFILYNACGTLWDFQPYLPVPKGHGGFLPGCVCVEGLEKDPF